MPIAQDSALELRRAAHRVAALAPFGILLEEGAPDEWSAKPAVTPRAAHLERAEELLRAAREDGADVSWDGTIQRVVRLSARRSANHPVWSLLMAVFAVRGPDGAGPILVGFPVAYP